MQICDVLVAVAVAVAVDHGYGNDNATNQENYWSKKAKDFLSYFSGILLNNDVKLPILRYIFEWP